MKTLALAGIVIVGIATGGFLLKSTNSDEPSKTLPASMAGMPPVAGEPPNPTATPAAATEGTTVTGQAGTALRQASEARKHLFVFIHETDDEQTQTSRKAFYAAVAKLGGDVQSIIINRSTPSESEFIEKYELQKAPMPIALVFAPNGAIVGGYLRDTLTEPQLLNALATPAMQTCMKALQDTKLVLLCAQNSSTQSNDLAMKGVNEFKADPRFAKFTEVVKVDPSDAAEKKFLTQLQLDPSASEAVTCFLAPPNALIAKIKGETDKNKLVAALQAASSGCGAGGCSPGGCSPRRN